MLRRLLLLCSSLLALTLIAPGSAAAAGPKIAIVSAANDPAIPADLKKKLEDIKLFDKVDSIDAAVATPTLVQLQAYDALAIVSDSRAFFDRVTLGNTLTQYADGGGGVVLMNPYVVYSFGGLAGDFNMKYGVTELTSVKSTFALDIMKVEPMHPVLNGVTTVKASGNRCTVQTGVGMATIKNGSRIIANWSDGNAMIFVGTPNNRPRVDLNMWAASSDLASGCWDPKADGPRLIANALIFVASPLRASPSSVDFGDVGVMTVSAPQTVEVKNTGSAPVVVNSGDVQPTGEFTVTLNGGASYPLTLNPGQSFTFDVRLRPNMTGARAATYVITPAMGMGGGATALNISLKGNGIGPRFGSAPETHDFGGIPFKGAGMTMSPAVMFQLKNVGGGQLRLKQVSLDDTVNFKVDLMGLMLPNILVGGAFQTVGVTFTPSMKMRFNGNLLVTYDLIGGATNQTATIPLQGSSGDPKIEIPGANITLQSVRVGKSGPTEYLTITNSGLADLSITGLMLSGVNPGDFKLLSAATVMNPIIVPPNGGQADLLVQFNPTVQGLRRATLTIKNDDPDPMRSMSQIILDARGTVATFAIDKMTLDFTPAQTLGNCSAPQTVTVTNTGDDDLQLSMIGFDGMNPSSFSTSVGPRRVPSGGGKVAIPVQFCPVNIGTQSANLVIATDLMAGHTAKVPLTGVGKGPHITANPMMVDFGPVYIKTNSQPQMITLKNEGDEAIVFGKSTINPAAGPFKVTGLPAEGGMLAPGATLTLTATANPQMSILTPGDISIIVNDQVLMGLLKIPLSVTGVQANITVMPKQMMFPVTAVGVKSPEQMLSILNSGMAPLTGVQITISGANAMDFGYTGDVPMNLEPNKSATLKVFFRPGGNNQRNGVLVINATGLAVPEQVVLSGTGKALSVSCSPDLLEFGVVRVGEMSASKQVICRNQDSAPIEVEAAFDDPGSMEYAFESEALSVPGSMGGDDGILTFKVTFQPSSTGMKSNILVIKAKDSGTGIGSVNLEGVATGMKTDMTGGCGNCAVARRGEAPAGGALLLLAGLLLLRLRRRGAGGPPPLA